jgi:hypothetical protein
MDGRGLTPIEKRGEVEGERRLIEKKAALDRKRRW